MPMLSVLCFALADYDNDCADGGVDDDGVDDVRSIIFVDSNFSLIF